jgi:pyruvate dehydrogenase E2 component (dihydrolipoamide acetyltransferase)
MPEFLMPKLGADMRAGTLVAWYKKPGEAVKRGDVIAEVETDKGDIDVEVFTDGVIDRFLVQPGETVPVGTPLASIREEGTSTPPAVEAEPPPRVSSTPAEPPVPVTPPLVPPAETGQPAPPAPAPIARLVMSPSARKLVRELGVDPLTVRGTGPGGAITREDIQRAAARRTEIPRPPAVMPPADRAARTRQAIATAMARSKREIPHYYLSTTIDMHRALSWLADENTRRPVTERLLYGVLLLKAVALALRAFPELNGFWSADRFTHSEAIHVGVAISLRQGGLIAPALHHADQQSLDELMKNFRDLVQRVRTGALRSSEVADPTITITSLGEQGVEAVFGVIYPPQVALVGCGKIVERPWVVDGQILPRPLLLATLAADHRVSDGHRGSLFLAAVERLLQEPSKL